MSLSESNLQSEAASDAVPRWFAIHTRARHEKQVSRQLTEKQFHAFLPLRRELHRWKDRQKEVELPLFSGYVFVQLASQPHRRLSVLKTPGVVRIVGFGQQDIPVPDEQIETLRRLLESNALIGRHRYLRVGQRVRIISGALAGVEGILKRIRNSDKLVISIDGIQQAVAVELSGYSVMPIGGLRP